MLGNHFCTYVLGSSQGLWDCSLTLHNARALQCIPSLRPVYVLWLPQHVRTSLVFLVLRFLQLEFARCTKLEGMTPRSKTLQQRLIAPCSLRGGRGKAVSSGVAAGSWRFLTAGTQGVLPHTRCGFAPSHVSSIRSPACLT